MRKIIQTLLFCTLTIQIVLGQEKNNLQPNDFVVSLVMPSYIEDLDISQIEKLQSTITNLLTANGIASLQMQNNLVIYPVFRLLEQRNISPGIQTIAIVEAEISLIIKQIDKNIIFSSITKQLKGSGRTRVLAIENALNQIKPEQSEYVDFLSSGKQKALKYYNQQCASIKEQAEFLSKTNQFAEALALLNSIPRETNCYSETHKKSIEIFKLYQNQVCHQLIQQAQAKIAARSFEDALFLLEQIDPQSICNTKVESIIADMSKKTSFNNQQQWETLKKLFVDNNQLNNYRLRLISDFLKRYYQHLPPHDYQTIIKDY